jgi:hypothetical protein
MARALIICEDAAEAFHTHQILTELFCEVKVCNRQDAAKQLITTFRPDLVVVSGLPSSGLRAEAVLRGVSVDTTAAVILWSGLESVAGPDPECSVRVLKPLTISNASQAMVKLGLSGIVNQSSLPLSTRSPANDEGHS